VRNQNLGRFNFVVIGKRRNRFAARVHKRGWHQQPNICMWAHFADYAKHFGIYCQFAIGLRCKRINKPKARVMPRGRVFIAWVAQANDKFYRHFVSLK
jgi:hypothetical protein